MRYDKLVVVRAAASRIATADFANATAHLSNQEKLARRLDSAAAALSPETGVELGSGLAARAELAGRMHTAHRTTQNRIEDARLAHDDAAAARRAARRALDAAVDICRTHDRERVIRSEAKAIPVKPKGPGQ